MNNTRQLNILVDRYSRHLICKEEVMSKCRILGFRVHSGVKSDLDYIEFEEMATGSLISINYRDI